MTEATTGEPSLQRRLGLASATFVVIANMIGTGAFTTTGLLLGDLHVPAAVLIAWVIGGLLALCGALAYAELSTNMTRNGGEYRFLTALYHPAVGFVAGWVSFVVGFSAPIAASALAFGSYLHALVPAISAVESATVLVVALSCLHASNVSSGVRLQNVFTCAKVVLVLVFIAGTSLSALRFEPLTGPGDALVPALASPAFAIALVFVSFAYSGWNGAAYLAGEVRDPQRTLPQALGIGTAIVTLLYVGLNGAFLLSAPAAELSGTVEVGHLVAVRLFGAGIGGVLAGSIALALVSSVSAMIMVGPRVYEAMGEDYRALSFLRWRSASGGPLVSTVLQAVLAILLLWTSSFGALLIYIGFTLSLFTALTVGGVFVARRRERSSPSPASQRDEGGGAPYRMWGYPVTPLLFVAFALWTAVYSIMERPLEALWGVGTVAAGVILYALVAPTRVRSERRRA